MTKKDETPAIQYHIVDTRTESPRKILRKCTDRQDADLQAEHLRRSGHKIEIVRVA